LACQIILQQALRSCLYIGDRNFGVFRIVQTIRSVCAHALVRLTEQRARKLLGRALSPGQYPVRWSPTCHDQLQPECSPDPVAGQLLVVRVQRKGFRALTLFLFSTLPLGDDYPAEELVRVYGVRWHIELNLRYLKDQMGLAQLECKSAEMAQKEWMAGLLAYNLVRAAMLCAALSGSIGPLTLSFSASRRHCQHWIALAGRGLKDNRPLWKETLAMILQCRLPSRRTPRPAEPRVKRRPPQPFPLLIGPRQKARQKLNLSRLKN
jgi:IS4 transposase